MSPFPGSASEGNHSSSPAGRAAGDRLDALAAALDEIDARLRAAEMATGDAKTAKELRRAMEAVAKHEPELEKRVGNRVDVLADRLATLAATVSTTAAALAERDGKIAALRRELEEGFARIGTPAASKGGSTDTAQIQELRRAISAMSEQKLPRNVDGRIDDVKATVEILNQRLATLSGTVSTTAAGLAGREGELAALRRKLDDERAQVLSEIAELRAVVDPAPVAELRGSLKTLTDATAALKRDNQRKLDGVKAALEALAQRVESVTGSAATTAHDLSSSRQQLTTLQAAFDEESSRVDSLLVKLHHATGELSSRVAELDGLATSREVDELAGRVGDLTTRVDTLGATVEETASGYADREFEIAALSRRFEEISAQIDARVHELRAVVEEMHEAGTDELEARLESVAREIEAVAGRLADVDTATVTGREEAASAVASLENRLASLQATVETAAEGTADRELEVRALSRRLEEISVQVEARVGELRASVEQMRDAGTEELGARLESLALEVEALAGRLAGVDAAAASGRDEASEAVAALEPRLLEIVQRLDDAERERVRTADAWVQERSTLAADSRALEERVAQTGIAFDESAAQLASLQASVDSTREALADRELDVHTLEGRFEEATTRVDSLVRDLRAALETMPTPVTADVVEREVAQASAEWAEERESIRSQLETLAAMHARDASGPDELRAALDEMALRLEATVRETKVVADGIARASEVWADERTSLRERLDELAAVASDGPTAADDELERLLPDLLGRLERLERDRAAFASEIAGATAFWSSGLGSIQARLDEVASAKEEGARKVDDEVVRALFDLKRRLETIEQGRTSGETELARVAEGWAADRQSLAAGVDELKRRLDAIDSIGTEVDDPSSPTPWAVSDGRFRVELRALELRMEHAEAAARENREAVLVQLERLASRIDSRFQRLEAGETPRSSPEASSPIAQVVPIHGHEG